MGFYSPHSLVQDARRHGVEVRTPDLNASAATATLEAHPTTPAATCDDASPHRALGVAGSRGEGCIAETCDDASPDRALGVAGSRWEGPWRTSAALPPERWGEGGPAGRQGL